jgi:hypothetical protein
VPPNATKSIRTSLPLLIGAETATGALVFCSAGVSSWPVMQIDYPADVATAGLSEGESANTAAGTAVAAPRVNAAAPQVTKLRRVIGRG